MFFKKKQKKEQQHKYAVDPLIVGQDSYGSVTVVRVDYRPFYDTRWAVVTPHFQTVITRDDTETAESLLDTIMRLPVFSKPIIESLDMRDQIYYD